MKSAHHKANFAPLSPVNFLLRGANFFGNRTAIIYGETQYSYFEFSNRVRGLAAGLRAAKIAAGDVVAILALNTPPMLEAHFAVPMIGGILSPLNVRLDVATIARALKHSRARLVICDGEFLELAQQAQMNAALDLPIVVINDPAAGLPIDRSFVDYEEFISQSPDVTKKPDIKDETQSISLLYTSGTTGTPKGVVYSHRGAYLAGLSNALSFGLTHDNIFLWTWPMFHSNGLSFIWSVTAVGGTHICGRSFDAPKIFDLIGRHKVSHFCAAPLVLNMLAADSSARDLRFAHAVNCITGGSPPPSSIMSKLEKLGIDVTHQYGSSECYGPATVALRQSEWTQLDEQDRYKMMARQGAPTQVVDDLMVADPKTMIEVPRDGATAGEIMLRGNAIMSGYYNDEAASREVFADGWYHTGDIAVWHSDGVIEIKDRSKDMIISGGENISSVEIEEVLYQHPEVHEAAVVAKPDKALVEAPCAFVNRVAGSTVNAEDLVLFCRSFLAESKIPQDFVFRELPKTATGKIQKYALREIAQSLDA